MARLRGDGGGAGWWTGGSSGGRSVQKSQATTAAIAAHAMRTNGGARRPHTTTTAAPSRLQTSRGRRRDAPLFTLLMKRHTPSGAKTQPIGALRPCAAHRPPPGPRLAWVAWMPARGEAATMSSSSRPSPLHLLRPLFWLSAPPGDVVSSHGHYQLDGVLTEAAWPVSRGPRLSPPTQFEQISVPPKKRLGLDQVESIAPSRVESGQQHHDDSVIVAQHGPLDLATHDDQLPPKQSILGNQLGPRPHSIVCGTCHDVRVVPCGIQKALDGGLDRSRPLGDDVLHTGDDLPQHGDLLLQRSDRPTSARSGAWTN